MRRRVAFWATVASPLLVVAVALLLAGILELLGADCVTYGNNPMASTTTPSAMSLATSSSAWAGGL